MGDHLYKGANQKVRGQWSMTQNKKGRNLTRDSAESQTKLHGGEDSPQKEISCVEARLTHSLGESLETGQALWQCQGFWT